MSIKDAIKVFTTNIVCIVVAILGVVGCMKFFKSTILLSLCIVVVIVSILVDLYTNIKIFSKKSPTTKDMSDKDIETNIGKYLNSGAIETQKAARNMYRQLETFARRKEVLLNLLNSYFSEDDNLYVYTSLTDKAQESIRDNIILALKRISIFDANEYNMLKNHQGSYSLEIRASKLRQYEEHLSYINKLIDSNDRLIIEFDNLITEVTRLNEGDNANDLSLLKDTVEAMRQLHFSEDEELSGLMNKY